MTIDKRRLPARRGTLPSFTPVPRHYQRHDGWTPERQLGFIEALAETGSVRAAAHRVNMTPEGAYLLRRHPEASGFRKAWEAALALGVQRLEDIAMERALHGTEVPVYSYGKLIGSRTVHNDRLVMFMLRNRAADRFGTRTAKRPDAVGKMELNRLKKQWRQEWEEERRTEDTRSEAEVLESIDAMIDGMRRNQRASMTARTRALYEAYLAASQEDQAAGRTGYDELIEAKPRPTTKPNGNPAPCPARAGSWTGGRGEMSLRELPDFLKQGDAELGFPRRRGCAHIIGRGFPEVRPVREPVGGDPMSDRDWAVWDWIRRVTDQS